MSRYATAAHQDGVASRRKQQVAESKLLERIGTIAAFSLLERWSLVDSLYFDMRAAIRDYSPAPTAAPLAA